MHEDERDVGKARSALSCISLIYYLADFHALILSTLEEESPFFASSPLPHVTSWLCEGFFQWATMFSEISYRKEVFFSGANAEKRQIVPKREYTVGGGQHFCIVLGIFFPFFFYLHHIHFICLFQSPLLFFRKSSSSFNGPLDTVWHFQVPSFLCLRCQPLNGVINVPPPSPKKQFPLTAA